MAEIMCKEQDIINEFVNGDNDAYTCIYNKYVKILFSYGKGLNFDQEVVKDCIQNVFFKILSNRNTLKDVQNIEYFLLRSLKNALLNSARSSKKWFDINDYDNTFSIEVTVLDQLIDNEEKENIKIQVENLLASLTNRQREAIYLRYSLAMDYKDIAKMLNISVPSARNIIAKAMSKMRNTPLLLGYIILSLETKIFA